MRVLESPKLFRHLQSKRVVLVTSITTGICYVKYARVVDSVKKKHYERVLEGFLKDFELFE